MLIGKPVKFFQRKYIEVWVEKKFQFSSPYFVLHWNWQSATGAVKLAQYNMKKDEMGYESQPMLI